MYGRYSGLRTFYLQSNEGAPSRLCTWLWNLPLPLTTRALMKKLAHILIHKFRFRQPPVDCLLLPWRDGRASFKKGGDRPNVADAERAERAPRRFPGGTWNSVNSDAGNPADARSALCAEKHGRQAAANLLRSRVNGFLGGAFGQGLPMRTSVSPMRGRSKRQ